MDIDWVQDSKNMSRCFKLKIDTLLSNEIFPKDEIWNQLLKNKNINCLIKDININNNNNDNNNNNNNNNNNINSIISFHTDVSFVKFFSNKNTICCICWGFFV